MAQKKTCLAVILTEMDQRDKIMFNKQTLEGSKEVACIMKSRISQDLRAVPGVRTSAFTPSSVMGLPMRLCARG